MATIPESHLPGFSGLSLAIPSMPRKRGKLVAENVGNYGILRRAGWPSTRLPYLSYNDPHHPGTTNVTRCQDWAAHGDLIRRDLGLQVSGLGKAAVPCSTAARLSAWLARTSRVRHQLGGRARLPAIYPELPGNNSWFINSTASSDAKTISARQMLIRALTPARCPGWPWAG